MRIWEWYQRIVLGLVALFLALIVLRLYGIAELPASLAKLRVEAGLPVYIVGGSVDVDNSFRSLRVEVENSYPLQVEVTNTPLAVRGDVEVENTVSVEVANTPLEVEIYR